MDLGCHDIDILSLTIRLTDTLGYIRQILIYLYICRLHSHHIMLYIRYFVLYADDWNIFMKGSSAITFCFSTLKQEMFWMYLFISLVIKYFLLVTQSHSFLKLNY